MKPRFNFNSNPKYDVELLIETESLNPFAQTTDKLRKEVWKEIADKLNKSDKIMAVTDRSCRERVQRLLKDFQGDEQLSKRASGIAEDDLSVTKELLGRIQQLAGDTSKHVKALYGKRKRDAAEKTGDQAVALMDLDPDDDTEATDDQLIPENTKPNDTAAGPSGCIEKPPPQTTPPSGIKIKDTIAYLEEKNRAKFTFKHAELEVKKMEAENRKAELELKKDSHKQDFELKQMEIQERAAMTKLLLSLAKTN